MFCSIPPGDLYIHISFYKTAIAFYILSYDFPLRVISWCVCLRFSLMAVILLRTCFLHQLLVVIPVQSYECARSYWVYVLVYLGCFHLGCCRWTKNVHMNILAHKSLPTSLIGFLWQALQSRFPSDTLFCFSHLTVFDYSFWKISTKSGSCNVTSQLSLWLHQASVWEGRSIIADASLDFIHVKVFVWS